VHAFDDLGAVDRATARPSFGNIAAHTCDVAATVTLQVEVIEGGPRDRRTRAARAGG
jgi:hypothetical protein